MDTEALERTWKSPGGLAEWFTVVNNQVLGKRFMVTAFLFFLVGGAMALMMRLQLARPEAHVLGPEHYNQLFTMHGSTMMYLFVVPFLEGLAVYLAPLMIGSRDLAYPRLTAFGYWIYLFGGLMLYASFALGAVPDIGWYAYTPLSSQYSGFGTNIWLLGLGLVELGGITAGSELFVTILKMRAPGMTLTRMPLFVWALLVTSVMILGAFTTLLMATLLLQLDRVAGTRFFDAAHGGNTLLWQHLFWFFGHPEVYIMFLPATGVVSMVIEAFTRRRIVAYRLVVMAIALIGFVSFGLWVHHMFTTGLPHLAMLFFTGASLMIAVASGTQIFAWIATLWGSRPTYDVPMLFILGFFFVFVLGGLTGVMVAVVPFDWQVHDTYFLVAHFHYVLIGGVVFPFLAGLHFWLPKLTGRMPLSGLGTWSFWLIFVGFNAAFFPMHLSGLMGMPRRVYTYPASLGVGGLNLVSTVGAFVLGLGFVLFGLNLLLSLRWGRPAPANPWGAGTLEWSISSPPPSNAFELPPVVDDSAPLWREPVPPEPALDRVRAAIGRHATFRATLLTDALTARPQAILYLPGPTLLPLVAALLLLAATVSVLVRIYPLALLFAAAFLVAFGYWLWPSPAVHRTLEASPLGQESGLPLFTTGRLAVGWWGMVTYLAVLAVVVAGLVYSYFYLRLYSAAWPQQGLPLPSFTRSGAAYGALVASALAQAWAQLSLARGRAGWGQLALLVATGSAAAFVGLLAFEVASLPFAPQANAYASIFHVLSWVAGLMGLVVLALDAAALVHCRWLRGPDTDLVVEVAALHAYGVGALGVLVFATLYLAPYLIGAR